MGNEDKPAFQLTGGELGEIIARKLSDKVERPVSTEVLSEELGIAKSTVAHYKDLGMPSNGYNSWMLSQCKHWKETVLPKILKRKPKTE